jgi:membrane associated rhomboid family serine protease
MIPIKDNIPTDRFPVITVLLILGNVVAYLLAVGHGGSLISGPDAHEMSRYGLVANAPTVKTVLTSMFLNGSIVQLVGNLLFLWLFGNNVEDSMGPTRFLGFYLAGGLVATAVQLALNPHSTVPTVGAAGAVGAVIGGSVMLYPRARVLTLVLIIFLFGVVEVPVLLMLGVWLVLQGVFGNGAPAYFGQLGGIVLGVLAVRVLATRRKATPPTAAAFR